MTLEIAEVVPSDAQGLLEASGLPLAGLQATSLWAARHAGAIVGVAGLERYGDVVLLRSVATEEGSRGQGVAAILCQAVLEEARAGGACQAFLLTETASGFFRRLGFEAVPRDAADPRLSASAEFQEGRCASAQLMSKRL